MATKAVFVAGHKGMVGSAICRQLRERADVELLTLDRASLDLTDPVAVADYFASQRIDEVYLAAAKVGGIHANDTYPAEFIAENLCIQLNLITSAHEGGVGRLLFLGSSCIYPKLAEQPMREEALLTGPLEPTNEPYAIAKIAGIKMCESFNRQYGSDFRSVMPTNLYGPADNFHPVNSHVVPGLMRRLHEAKVNGAPVIEVWGTGKVRREFMHVDDMATACVHVMECSRLEYEAVTEPTRSHLNVGTGTDCSIRELAEMLKEVVGFTGELTFDSDRPEGTPRKLLDVSRLNELGWRSEVGLEDGLRQTYGWFIDNAESIRG